MKDKIIILVACLFLATVNLSAKSLVLTLKNGTLVYYLLGEKSNPMLRFVDSGILIDTDRYEFSNVKNFCISSTDDPSSIEHSMKKNIQYDHNIVVVDTDKPLSIKIYTYDGRETKACLQQINGKILIDLNPLPKGAYIVNIGKSSLKVFKK